MPSGETIYFCNHFPATKTGGAETTTRDWSEGFQRRGMNVVWYCPSRSSNNDSIPIPEGTQLRQFNTMPFRGGRRLVQPESLISFYRDMITEKPKKVIFSFPADERLIAFMYTAFLAGRPDAIVAVFHGNPLPPQTDKNISHSPRLKTLLKPAYNRLRKQLIRTTLAHPDVTSVAVSQATAHKIQELKLVTSLPVVCPPSSPHNNQDCHPHAKSTSEQPLKITTVCRVSPEKGLLNRFSPLALASASRDLPATFSVVGPIEQPELAKAVTETSQGTVTFEGPKYGSDLCQAYIQTALFALFSDTEGSGLVLAESARHATPIMGTDIPAIREFMSASDQPVGVLLDPNDPNVFVNQGLEFITHILRHPESLHPLSLAVLALSHHYDPETLTNHFIDTVLSK